MQPSIAVYAPAPGSVTMFTTSWCGFCRRLKHQLDRDGVTYAEIDIDDSAPAAEVVMSVNGGNRTVPTVVFPDGSTATNPSSYEVMARLGR